ncbi:T-cell surface glycoprotein CD5 [Tiliqua scincoides]|uniref:T-cell surface glycoprotein CD5 n=1 Tax=Tiliqua scincoides TaxID=71010 RepID=UPI0034633BE1
MTFKHLDFIPLMLMGLWVATCDDGINKSPEEWDVRFTGTGSSCSGWMEIFHRGKWKRICSEGWTNENAAIACRQLQCGSPFGKLEHYSQELRKQEAMAVKDCWGNVTTLKECWWDASNCTQHLAMVCVAPVQISTVLPTTPAVPVTSPKPTDTSPRIRLEDGSSLCTGTVSTNREGHWEMACLGLQGRWREMSPRICKGANCEDALELKDLWRNQQPLPAYEEKMQCEKRHLSSGCLNGTEECLSIMMVTCSGQESKPSVSTTVTVLGILLGLALVAVILPPCYKKLVKKYAKKRERQWIGPNGVNQNVSFHRISSAAVQPKHEVQGVREVENKDDHSFKKISYLSSYSALEGKTNRSSNPLDNSSDSDYDLCSAQPL